jgi:hypothetical protein
MGLKMDYALVNKQTNIIENVVALEEGAQWTPPSDMTLVPLTQHFGIGDTWDGTAFIRKPIPEVVEETIVGQAISSGTQSL